MIIKMMGLYGFDDTKAYFREIGDGCFDFVNNKKYASDLSREEAEKVMKHKDWYLNNYKADIIFIMDKK